MTKGGRYKPGHDWQPRRPDNGAIRPWDRPALLDGPSPEERDAVRLAAETAALDGER
jgi:hypothetical protein